MTLQFEDILSAICTEIVPSHANDYQKIYALNTGLEAKLAFDVLISLGFDVKVYHTPEKPSKLYITNPTMTEEQLEQRLSAALAYVRALKAIKVGLDELCAGGVSSLIPASFTIAFVNAQANGKQILIQLSQQAASVSQQAAGDNAAATSPANSEPAAAAPAGAIAAKSSQKVVTASSPRTAKKRRKKDPDEFAAGPAVGRGLYPGKAATDTPQKETLRKRILLQLFGNFATSGYATLIWLVVAGMLFSFVVFAKSFLCYDFVAKKSTKWYCQDQAALQAQEEARKATEKERQQKLGLAPVQQ